MGEADVDPITRGEGGGGVFKAGKGAPVTASPTHQDPREAQELEDGRLGGGDDLGRGLRWCSMKGRALPQLQHQSTWNQPILQLQVSRPEGLERGQGGLRARSRDGPG